MLETVKKTIVQNELIKKGDSVLVAISGGADSVSLLDVLCALRDEFCIKVSAAHVNHGIRGKEADRDEEFVKALAEKYGIDVYVKHANIREEAKKEGVSEETAGRKVRYAFFEYLAKKHNINKIATAHNKNDNAETILMNLMRGAALSGLSGIPYKRENIIRPILNVGRDEIEEYCRKKGLEYVTDSTNAERIYTRNKIRLDLIPFICENFNDNFVNTITKNSHIIADMYDYINVCAQRICCEKIKKTENIKELHPAVARQVIYRMLSESGISDISSVYIEEVLKLVKMDKSGSKVDLPLNVEAIIEHGVLAIRKKQEKIKDFEYELTLGEEKFIAELNMNIKITETEKNDGECFTVEQPCKICVRNRRSGDVFYPVGMSGRKKLKDFMIDKKIPVSERDKVGIITFDGEIGYIIGKRRDRRFNFKTKGIKVEYTYCNK